MEMEVTPRKQHLVEHRVSPLFNKNGGIHRAMGSNQDPCLDYAALQEEVDRAACTVDLGWIGGMGALSAAILFSVAKSAKPCN